MHTALFALVAYSVRGLGSKVFWKAFSLRFSSIFLATCGQYVKFLTEHVRIRHNTRWSQADLKHSERNGQ
jgi:hypothetical protein